MITYVNTVLVSNASAQASNTIFTDQQWTDQVASSSTDWQIHKGRFVCYDVDSGKFEIGANTKRFKIGMVTGKVSYDHKGLKHPEVKWSNIIQVSDIKSVAMLGVETTTSGGTTTASAGNTTDTEDTITINFHAMEQNVENLLKQGGKRVIVRLTFKDLPTRFRKWTESYEYVTKDTDTKDTIATAIAELINKQWKRARVTATASNGVLTLTAMKYDDDNSVDSINWYNKVRFNANIYYTDPAAEGWESLNKHYPTGVEIVKTAGSTYPASAKLVRDREAQAMGYEGILNRGEGTWPIIKPAMNTNLSNTYYALTLEFENMYRAADDIFRKNKQSVEIYCVNYNLIYDFYTKINAALGKNGRVNNDTATEHNAVQEERA